MQNHLTESELHKLISASKNLKQALILKLLASTGISRFELTNIKARDIDFETKQLTIQKGKSPANLSRNISMDDSILQTIKFYLGPRKTGYLIQSNKADKISLSQINRIVQKTAKMAQMPKVSPKTLRHSYALNQLNQGASFTELQKNLGHKDLRTTIRMYKKPSKIKPQNQLENPANFMQI